MDENDPAGKKVLYERVALPVKRRVTRGSRAGQLVDAVQCVKAGGRAAKRKLQERGCAPGKVLKVYVNGNRRCVKAVGDLKDCPVNLVVGEKVQSGVAKRKVRDADGAERVVQHPWTKAVKRCVKPATATARGYRVLRQGGQPLKPYRLPR